MDLRTHEKLLLNIEQLVELSADDRRVIERLFVPRKLEKGENFLMAGDICRHAAFIQSGVFRFYINRDGEDATYYFAAENEFICEYPSFLRRQPSDRNIQALEAAEILLISHDDLQIFYQKVRFGERFGRLVAEKLFVDSVEQLASFYGDKPEARYRNFVRQFPQLVRRLPQYYIASYVGIKPQSLSRIRRRFLTTK